MYRKDQFPIQPVPLYCFQIKDGVLTRTEHVRYEKVTHRSMLQYRIHTGSGIRAKTPDKLDAVLNGCLWTFDGSCQHAISLFRQRAEGDAVRAAVMSETARAFLLDVQAAERDLAGKHIQ